MKMPRLIALGLVWLCVGACHKQPPKLPILRTFPLLFDGPPGAPPRPFVAVGVNGHADRWLVDTSATNNVVGWWFMKSVAVATTMTPERGDGIIGVAGPVTVQLGPMALKNDHFPVVNMLPELEQRQVGGILSPQLLAVPGTTLILNLKAATMTMLSGPLDPNHDDGPGWSMAPGGMKLCHPNDDTGARYLVAAQIGDANGWMEVATGATQSRLYDDVTGLDLSKLQNHVARGVELKVGEGRVRANLLVVPRPPAAAGSCNALGLLGMDVLRSCVLLLDGKNGLGRCWR